ncbi:hypothetical protein FQR65_LT02255 [Abscondita terminalis]|nr:hypothetical protein FQR65_LT02255 [Abscondita terminalis]
MESIDENNSGSIFETEVKPKRVEWKEILLLQFQPQFQVVIILSIFVAYHCCIIDFAKAYGCSFEEKGYYQATALGLLFCCDIVHAIDILLMMSYRNVQWAEVEHLYEKRSSLGIVVDIFSIIPWDALYVSLDDTYNRKMYVLRLRYALRLYRLLYKTKQLQNAIGAHIFARLLDFAICYTLLLTAAVSIFYTALCRSFTCTMSESLRIVFFYMNGLLLFGGDILHMELSIWCIIWINVFSLCSYLYYSAIFLSRMILVKIQKYEKRELFRSFQHFALHSCKTLDKDVESTCKRYLRFFWKSRRGIIFDNKHIEIIPKGMAKEINLDVSWFLFKHSHLFRDQEIEFYHAICPFIKHQLLMPGEVIFKRKQRKSKMVYVFSGVVQILSEHDGETPILSLTAGTCIGESTLVLDYPSTCTVVCQDACEILGNKKYYNAMLKSIDTTVEERVNLIFRCLKATLDELLNCKNTSKENFSVLSMYAEKKLFFCTKYLNLLSLSEKSQLVTDTVFLRDTFPWIFQPDSFLIKAWNLIIELTAFIFLIIYPYNVSFQINTSLSYFFFSYTILLLWLVDIYVLCSTSIKNQYQFATTIGEIALVRIQNPKFFMDLIAIIPLGLVIYVVDNNVKPHQLFSWQFLRLFKCYRIENLFYYSKLSIVTQTYHKFTVYLLLLIYYIAAFVHLMLKDDQRSDFGDIFKEYTNSSISNVILFSSVITQEVTNKGPVISYEKNPNMYILLLVQIMPFLFYIYFVSSIVAMQILHRINELKQRNFVTGVVTLIKSMNIKPHISALIMRHVQNQLQLSHTINYRSYQSALRQIYPPVLLQNINMETFGLVFKSVQLFSNLPKTVLLEIVEKFYSFILGPGEIVKCSGETCREMYIILEGYCQVASSSKNSKIILGANSVLSAFELFANVPVMRTIITITHCNLIVISRQDILQVLIRYPSLLSEFQNTAQLLSINMFSDLMKNDDENLLQTINPKKPNSFKHFGFKLYKETTENTEYHKPFDELEFLGCLRYILFRSTIKPDGNFLKYWEISRCFFAFSTAILTPFVPLSTCRRCVWYYVMLFLDVTAWLDIFVRHQVCYFNKENIEVTHPLKTAIHYWKNSFVVDLIGIIPWHSLVIAFFKIKLHDNHIVYFKMIKLLQTYRMFRGIEYLIMNPTKTFVIVTYIPVTLLLINTIGAITINTQCKFDASINSSKDYATGVECSPTSWLVNSPFEKPFSALRVYLYGIFYATIVMAGPSPHGLLINKEEIHQTAVLSILGYLYFIYVTTNIVSSHIFRHGNLTLHQKTMSNLVKFLSVKRLDPVLRREVVEHFKYVFKSQQRKIIRQLIKQMSSTIEAQFLLEIYGDTLKYSFIFAGLPNSVLRNLLLYMQRELILHKGIICKVNDIHDKIYLVVKGQVDVLGADYNHLIFLGKGSLFGNLADIGFARQKLTVVAKGHVQLLSITNKTFHSLITQNVHLRVKYNNLILFNADYIVEQETRSIAEPDLLPEQKVSITSTFTTWEMFIVGIVCCLGFLVELYLITMQDHTIFEILFVYFCDQTISQLSISIIMRIVVLGVRILVVIQTLTSILILISCINPESNIDPLLACNWTNASSQTKLYIYIDHCASILSALTGTALLKVPNSPTLILFFITLLIGLKFFGILIVKEVAAMLQMFIYRKLKYEKTAYELKDFLSWRQTSLPLVTKVCVYINFLWKCKQGEQYPKLLDEMPYYLREAVLNSLYGYLLRKHHKFSLCHVDLIRQISSKMRPVTFLCGDFIAFKTDINETMYFVHEGGVDAIVEETMSAESISKTFGPGENFGYEAGLHPSLPHVFTYKANQLTVIIVLQRSEWIYLLDFFPASKNVMLNE